MRRGAALALLALGLALGAGAEEPPEKRRFGVSIDRSQALSVTSDELESFKENGARRLIFTRNVVVEQADVRILTQRLEALYPKGAKQPDRLVATGDVVVQQGDRTARCQEATYHRAEQSLVCRGGAEVQDGQDRVRGEVIEFDLDTEAVVVTGGAEVVLHPRPEDLEERREPGDPEVPSG